MVTTEEIRRRKFIHAWPMFIIKDESKKGLRFGDVVRLPPGNAFVWHQYAPRQFIAEWLTPSVSSMIKSCRLIRVTGGRIIQLQKSPGPVRKPGVQKNSQ